MGCHKNGKREGVNGKAAVWMCTMGRYTPEYTFRISSEDILEEWEVGWCASREEREASSLLADGRKGWGLDLLRKRWEMERERDRKRKREIEKERKRGRNREGCVERRFLCAKGGGSKLHLHSIFLQTSLSLDLLLVLWEDSFHIQVFPHSQLRSNLWFLSSSLSLTLPLSLTHSSNPSITPCTSKGKQVKN